MKLSRDGAVPPDREASVGGSAVVADDCEDIARSKFCTMGLAVGLLSVKLSRARVVV